MEENYLIAKDLVLKKYGKSYQYYSLLVLALSTLLYKYNDNKQIVIDIFNNIDIYIENNSLENIAKKYNLEIFDDDEDYESFFSNTIGLSSVGIYFSINEDDNVVVERENPFIICSSLGICREYLLNTFIHEMNHLIKSYIDGYKEIKDDKLTTYCVRTGLHFYCYKYDPSTDTIYESNYYKSIDEVINTLETTDMMENILKLDGIVPDNDVQKMIDSLDREKLSEDYGYYLCVSLFKTLWANDIFKNLIEDSILEGKIKTIVNEFDKIIGDGSFDKIVVVLDKLFEYDLYNINSIEFDEQKKFLEDIIADFNKKTNFVYKK